MYTHKQDKWDIKILIREPKKTKRNGELLPDSIRCITVGPSGCGKTTLMIDKFFTFTRVVRSKG